MAKKSKCESVSRRRVNVNSVSLPSFFRCKQTRRIALLRVAPSRFTLLYAACQGIPRWQLQFGLVRFGLSFIGSALSELERKAINPGNQVRCVSWQMAPQVQWSSENAVRWRCGESRRQTPDVEQISRGLSSGASETRSVGRSEGATCDA